MPLLVKKPIAVLDKKLTVAWGEFWKGLGKTVTHLAVAKLDEIPGDLVEVGAAVGLLDDPGEAAWLLIRRALSRALRDLIREHRDLFANAAPEATAEAEAEAGLAIDDEVVEIDERFFVDPGELELIARLRKPLAHWFGTYGVKAAAASAISERLRAYFVLALHDEWGRAPADYARLQEAIDTPFTRAQDLERAWLRYEAHLWRQVNEPMFAEAFGLKSVYVPLRAYWEQSTKDDTGRIPAIGIGAEAEETRSVRVVVDLARELDSWVDANRRECRLRVLSGGPGSGKSSFTRIYAAATMTRGKVRVLYIPLHLFDPKGDLVNAVGDYVRASRLLPSNPLEIESSEHPRPLLLLFDGLDELAMQGKQAADTARDFVREVDRTLDRLNQMNPWVSAVVSGRELVVQANATELRRKGQVLHLLPYFADVKAEPIGDGLRKVNAEEQWDDPDERLSHDQRRDWWEKYRIASGMARDQIPEELLMGELGDVTRQPLLLYLVALSFARGRLDLGPQTNLNDVYSDLIDAVWERAYEGRPFPGIREIKREHFRRVLEEIGLTAWHDERRTTTVRAIQQRFESAALTGILKAFEQGAELGVTRLLAAFYFRQHGERDGERTFEFTHKSFGEYLAACRIARTLVLIDRDMDEHEKDPDRGKDVTAALVEWAEICGPAALDEYYVRFLNREIWRGTPDDVKRWHGRVTDMLSAAAATGTPIERLRQRPTTLQEELRRARNADEALFACAAACADVVDMTTNVQWPTEVAAGEWLRRLQGQRSGAANRVILKSLRRVDFGTSRLDGLDLYAANLTGSALAVAHYSWLDQAQLYRAQLQGSVLIGARLQGAQLEGAHLVGANLLQANLLRANLSGAHLRGAVLADTNLESANLQGANLENAILVRANLENAVLTGANLKGANLENAILRKADLKGAVLTGANVKGAVLSDAELEGATVPKGIRSRGKKPSRSRSKVRGSVPDAPA